MAKARIRHIDFKTAKRRLRLLIAVFFIGLAGPIYLLLDKVYEQLENEAYFKLRSQAEATVQRIEQRLLEIVESEQNRPIAEYSFFNILESPLLQSAAVKFSPLSEVPPRSAVPGLIGYFQINPDGSFGTPALPELDKDKQAGLSDSELHNRLALRDRLQTLLSSGDKQDSAGVAADKPTVLAEKTKNATAQERYRIERDMVGGSETRYAKGLAQGEAKEQSDDGNPAKKTRTLSDEQLQQFNIDTKLWRQKPGSASEKSSNYLSRKELVKLPSQSLGKVFDSSAPPLTRAPAAAASSDLAEPVMQQERASVRQKEETEVTTAGQKPIRILSFESEVGPLQLLRLNDDYFCFFRQVWRNHSRYVQGFIVAGKEFFAATVNPSLEGAQITDFSSVLLAYDGAPLQQFKLAPAGQETLLYRASLAAPLNNAEIVINGAAVPAAAGAMLVDALAAALGLVLISGLAVFYRLGVRQIDLAQRQRNFISAVSHELKTPLTSIRMYAEMLRAGWVSDPAKQKSYYDFIFFESERLSRLIANVLQLARTERGAEAARLVQIAPQQLLQRVAVQTAAQAEAAAFELHVLPCAAVGEELLIAVDADAFAQIIINLVDNALKFSTGAEQKRIDLGLRISPREREATFFVRDYGPGVERKQMRKIFQLFYRPGDELTRTKPGAGIGLALVQQLAENMQARIDLLNRSPGAEFQVKFRTFSGPISSAIA